MAQVSTRSQEYWRPANPNVARLIDAHSAELLCLNCGIEYQAGARFCHLCGSKREPGPHDPAPAPQPRAPEKGETRLPSRLALPLASTVCFVLGVGCAIGAGLIGVIYRTDTLVDWQAVQVWRIEWLLATLAALLAGVLLKKAR